MLCLARRAEGHSPEAAALLWYEDPESTADEMLPPSLQAQDLLLGRGVTDPGLPMKLVLSENKTFVPRPGLLFWDAAKLFFDDAEAGIRFCLAFPTDIQQRNNELLTTYGENIPTTVELCKAPLLSQPGVPVSYLKDARNLAELWMGSLIVSRCKITQFLVCNLKNPQPVFSFPRASPRFAEKVSPENLNEEKAAGIFLAFLSMPKPASLETFLSYGGEVTARQGIRRLGSCCPIHEGYYKITLSDFEKSEDGSHHTITKFDDYSGNKGHTRIARCDFGVKPDHGMPSIGLPDDSDTVIVSMSALLTLQKPFFAKAFSKKFGDWGFSGPFAIGDLFILPVETPNDELFEVNRSMNAPKFFDDFRKVQRSSAQSEQKCKVDVLSGIHNRANYNTKRLLVQNNIAEKIQEQVFSVSGAETFTSSTPRAHGGTGKQKNSEGNKGSDTGLGENSQGFREHVTMQTESTSTKKKKNAARKTISRGDLRGTIEKARVRTKATRQPRKDEQ